MYQFDNNFTVLRGATAEFDADTKGVLSGLACRTATSNGCEVADCVYDGGTPGVGDSASAGTVSVQAAGLTLALNEVVPGRYVGGVEIDAGYWWSGGEVVTATATGSDGGAPGFTAGFHAPTRLSFMAPANDGGTLVVRKGSTLPITWTPGTGSTTIALRSGRFFGHSLFVMCTENASAGKFTLPAALTQNLLPTTEGALTLTNMTETTVTPSGWTIRVVASTTDRAWPVTVPP